MNEETARIFLGTYLDQENCNRIKTLNQANADLAERLKEKVRWVRPEKLHITWVFLGDVEKVRIAKLCSTAREKIAKHASPMLVSYDQLTIWPTQTEPRHLVLTPKVVPKAVLDLASLLRESLLPLVLSGKSTKDTQPQSFNPHLTLLRLGERNSLTIKPVVLAKEDLVGLDELLPVAHHINEIALIESHLGTDSGQYNVLDRFSLL